MSIAVLDKGGISSIVTWIDPYPLSEKKRLNTLAEVVFPILVFVGAFFACRSIRYDECRSLGDRMGIPRSPVWMISVIGVYTVAMAVLLAIRAKQKALSTNFVTGQDAPYFRLDVRGVKKIQAYYHRLKYLPEKSCEDFKIEIPKPKEFSKKETRLPRSFLDLCGKMILIASLSKGDNPLQKGSYKKIKLAFDLNSSETFVCASAKKYLEKEIALRQRFSCKEGFVKVIAVTPRWVIEERYDYDLVDFFNKDVSLNDLLIILPDLFKGLKQLHQNGLIHRDVKIENFLIKKDPIKKYAASITDFGFMVEKNTLNHSMIWAGTRAYISPEHLAAIKSRDEEKLASLIDESLDIYALGVTLQKICSVFEVSLFRRSVFLDLQTLITKMVYPTKDKRATWEDIEAFFIKHYPKADFDSSEPMGGNGIGLQASCA